MRLLLFLLGWIEGVGLGLCRGKALDARYVSRLECSLTVRRTRSNGHAGADGRRRPLSDEAAS